MTSRGDLLGHGIGRVSAEMDRESGTLYLQVFSDEEDDPNDYRTLLSLEKTLPEDAGNPYRFTFKLSEHPETGEEQKYTALLEASSSRSLYYSRLYIYPQYGKNIICRGRIMVNTKRD